MTEPPDQELVSHFPIPAAELADLSRSFSARAAAAGLVDIGYRTIDSPIGPLLLAATEAGLIRIAFNREGFDQVLTQLAEHVSPRVVPLPRRLDSATTQLEEYFAGGRHSFDLTLDHRLASGFRYQVQAHLPTITYGQTRSYGQIAQDLARPRAVRAVGTACATNPLPIVVPCHRVVRNDGSLGGYLGGLDAKKALLHLEQSAA